MTPRAPTRHKPLRAAVAKAIGLGCGRAAVALAIALGCGGAALGASPHTRDPFQAPPVATSRASGGGAAAQGVPGLAGVPGAPAVATASAGMGGFAAGAGTGLPASAGLGGSATGGDNGTGGNGTVAPAISELQLLAVIYDGAHSLANIGGRIVAVGDVVDDYQVAAIGARSVLLRQGARRVTLTMNQKAPR